MAEAVRWRHGAAPAHWASLTQALLLVALGCSPGADSGVDSLVEPTADSAAEGGATVAAALPPPSARDAILVTVDTLRADALGFAGNAEVRTPFLDRLAAGGRVFAQARAHNVVTLPSHANILTGLHPYEHGVRDNVGFKLDGSVPTLATRFQEAGFATAAFVAAFPLDERFGLARGFDVYDDRLPASDTSRGLAERAGDVVVAAAGEWWRANEGRPRFLWVHLYEPHAPYLPPEPFASRHPDTPYLGEVEAVDACLSTLLTPILETPSADTLIVVTADHGEGLGDHGEKSHGLFAYEATLRVPLVLWGGGVPVGLDSRPARHVDIAPTVLERLGLDSGETSGASLLAVAQEESSTYFEALTATLSHGWAPLRGVVAGGMKAIELPEAELYELADDPRESRNRAASEPGLLRDLLRRLPRESRWPPRAGTASAEEQRGLQALGYLSVRARAKTGFTVDDDPKRLIGVHHLVHESVGALEAGDAARAASLAREALAERPDMATAHYYLALALLAQGRTGEALAGMREVSRQGHATPLLERQLALTLSSVGEAREALTVLGPAVEAGDPDALAALGVVLSNTGDQQGARQALLRAELADRDNPTTQETFALVAIRAGDWTEAKARAERALALDPRLDLAWSYLGGALYNLGDPRAAVEAWQRSLAIDPSDFDVLYNLATVAFEIGLHDEARSALERFIRGAPRDRYGRDIERARQRLETLLQAS